MTESIYINLLISVAHPGYGCEEIAGAVQWQRVERD